MMKKSLIVFCMAVCCHASAQDSLRTVALGDVVVESSRVGDEVPMAVQSVSGRTLRRDGSGRDLPWLLAATPSVVVGSDNGLGIGLSSMRIRGTDASRINVTFDGVALNDPEDQTVWWANMSSFASSLDGLQVQRGVGTSTNGSGAFGGTVTMQSQRASLTPEAEATAAIGSYGTHRYEVKGSSGLLGDHWAVDGRVSQTDTRGYIDGTDGRLGSHFASLSYFGPDYVVRLKNFGSFEHMGQAWNGVPSDSVAAGHRTCNSLGHYTLADGTDARRNTMDHYTQNHTHLAYLHDLGTTRGGAAMRLNATAHYTLDNGFYDDLRAADSYAEYLLPALHAADGTALTEGDVIRQKWIDSRRGGILGAFEVEGERLHARIGFSASMSKGFHYGLAGYADEGRWSHRNKERLVGGEVPRYYKNDSRKADGDVYAKLEYAFRPSLTAYLDLQERGVGYTLTGSGDDFHADGSQQQLDVDKRFAFFNPKAGLHWQDGGLAAHLSFARTHREPTRNNYTDQGASDPLPRPETLNDWEGGGEASFGSESLSGSVGINVYAMEYRGQLVQTGQLSDIGEALSINVDRSYRRGVELTAGLAAGIVRWNATATLSRNRIIDFVEYVDNWEGDAVAVHYDSTPLAFSPSATASSLIAVGHERLSGSLQTVFVGRQYLDNTGCDDRSLDPYCVSHLTLCWAPSLPSGHGISLQLSVQNLFSTPYATGGWVYTAVSPSLGYDLAHRYREDGLFVQAPRTLLLTLRVQLHEDK